MMNTLEFNPLKLNTLVKFDGRQLELRNWNNGDLPGVPKNSFYHKSRKPRPTKRKKKVVVE